MKNGNGNCLSAAFNLLCDYNLSKKDHSLWRKIPEECYVLFGKCGEPVLAHGIVWHDEAKWHLHAWIEDERFCYDYSNGLKMIVPKKQYYKIGKIKDVKRYSYKEAALKSVASGMLDFWDFKNTNVYKNVSVSSLQ